MLFLSILFGLVLAISSTTQSPTLSELVEKFNALEQKVITLEQKANNSEAETTVIQNKLAYGGKKYQTLQYSTS